MRPTPYRTSGPAGPSGSRLTEGAVMRSILGLAAVVCGAWLLAGTAASAAESCAAEGKISYLCGPANAEDLALVPGTRWIITSGMTSPSVPTGHFYLIDTK